MDEATDRTEEVSATGRTAWRDAPVSMCIATVGGLGHLPVAPGTWGTLAALPLVVAWPSSPIWRFGILAVMLAAAVPAATRAGRALGEPDSSRIVVDEFVGMTATVVWFSHLTWPQLLVGVVAFRVFDVLKPPGARWLHTRRHDGTGVIGDDLVAAFWSAPLVALLLCLPP